MSELAVHAQTVWRAWVVARRRRHRPHHRVGLCQDCAMRCGSSHSAWCRWAPGWVSMAHLDRFPT